ncbi:MAG: Lin0512 family protein [Burkholderiales bacterium]|nr:Lin0512 family protein [Burkholderiales bacterium]
MPHGSAHGQGGRGRTREIVNDEDPGSTVLAHAAAVVLEASREVAAMPLKRVILEMGAGNDLHGGDYTKAALRAVQDALHHSSLALVRSLDLDINKMQVEVTIGVQQPQQIDAAAVKASLPYGQVTVHVVKGGLDVPAEGRHDLAVIASAAIAVRFDLP